jgi:hydrogenase expression/formation protein HypC
MCLAIPGRILEVTGEEILRRGRVDFGGLVREVSLAAVPEAEVGAYVIVHAGMALSVLDEAEALEVIETIRALDAAADEDARA